ncbi:hypothetical protein GCM10008107_12520 [Psychrosphaera saromensis]|uniref:Response regulatory domain-containing protein n=1 Tax=Psychrosphaera saromensis TaxID=716813 RepID=A0A2S7UU31_9GAMM|nr:response regulator [Psychrosphaera saromensis]PQJ53496.1 hypothetical protein BTO11_07330 [Psychrosphaera saromensis]GHB65007.1 hypothetical protein GCM10008107_12520 [Psychrosphaera saromensis]GLQ14708.1 hypothetical protein GCM10007917_21630 [Psychrosphaera saromensis]
MTWNTSNNSKASELENKPNPDSVAKAQSIPSLSGDVLLVEDNKVNQHLFTFNIEKTGAKVDLAENGQEGLQKALSNHYDLILMDIEMPLMDGKEVMSSLVQLGINTPVYALTANNMPSDIAEYSVIGFRGTLSKPVELTILYQILGQHLTNCNDKVHNTAQRDKILVQDPKIRAMFYTDLAKQHSEITEYIQELNYSELIKVIHVINGLAGNFGYDELTDLAAESLRFLRNKQYQQAIQHCSSLNQKVAEVLNEYND